MANGRHSFVAFYPSDWLAGTARMSSRILRSVYFDVCLYNWDTARACPPMELAIMLGDVRDWKELVEQLIAMGKLIRNEDGSVENPKAMVEAAKAFRLHSAKSAGGSAPKSVRKTVYNSDGSLEGIEPEPEPDTPKGVGAVRACQLPSDFLPVLTDKAQANADKLGTGRYERELEQFKDHHRAKGSRMKDWQAAFRTWLANAVKFQKGGNGGGGWRDA